MASRIAPAPGQFTMLYAFGVGEIADLGFRRRRRPARPHRARGRRRQRRDLRRQAGRRARRARAVRHAWPLARGGRRATSSSSPAASVSRRCAPRSSALERARADYGEVTLLYGGRTPGDLLFRARARRSWRRRGRLGRRRHRRRGARAAGRAGSASCRSSIEGARFDPGSAVALVCGPEIMMRFTRRGAARARRRGRSASTSRWSATCSCAVGPLRPLPARADADLPRRPGLQLRPAGAAAGGARAVSAATPPQAQARRLEVRLLRRLPALAARLRGRAARARRRGRDRLLPGGQQRRRCAAPTTSRWSRARSRRPTTASGSGACAARRAASSRSAPARPPAGSRRCATSPTSTSSSRSSTRTPRVHLDARDLDADLRARRRRLRAARLPDRQAPAARGDRRPAGRPAARRSPRTSVCTECKRRGTVCVMVAHGTPCLGPGHARRLRRDLPELQPRLLRLLRPDGDAERRRADARSCATLGADRDGDRPRLPHLQRGGRAVRRRRGRAMAERRTKTIRTDTLARVEGEGAMHVRIEAGRVTEVELRSTSRRASSRRSCAAATSPRRSTSPPGSAGSARSPTR